MFFKSEKSWPGSAEERGYQLSHSASPVSYIYALSIHAFSWHVLRETFLSCFTLTPGTDKKGGADTLSSPTARGTDRTSSDEDAGPGALQGAEEESREGG